MTLITVSVRVSKRRTSPDSEAAGWLEEEDAAGRVWPAVDNGEVGDGTGDG